MVPPNSLMADHEMIKERFPKIKSILKEMNLDEDEKRQAFYEDVNKKEKLTNEDKINSMPQIYINDKRIGGYKELKNSLTLDQIESII